MVAVFLWYGRLNGNISSATTEPVAFLLSAYAALSSIFAWMLYSPNRRSSEQSPALFISGAVTLLPPCIIAFCLMPSDSPLRIAVTFGVFLLTMIAVTTPVPEEFFAVPRDRATYLRPISDAIFSRLSIRDGATKFDNLTDIAPRRNIATTPSLPSSSGWPVDQGWPVEGGDPWQDPFIGTGIEPVVPGSKARKNRQTVTVGTQDRTVRDLSVDSKPSGVLPVKDAVALRSDSDQFSAHRAQVAAPNAESQLPSNPGSRSSAPTWNRPVPNQSAAAYRPPVPVAFGFRPPPDRPQETDIHHNKLKSPFAEISPPAPAPARTRDAGAYGLDASGRTGPDLLVADRDFTQRSEDKPSTGGASVSERPPISVERIQDEYGGEMVEGTARVSFLAGQKKANVHIPFTPALPGIPEVECESVGDEVLRLKVPVRQSYGIRIEARRTDASEPLETEIGFAAVYSPPNRRVS